MRRRIRRRCQFLTFWQVNSGSPWFTENRHCLQLLKTARKISAKIMTAQTQAVNFTKPAKSRSCPVMSIDPCSWSLIDNFLLRSSVCPAPGAGDAPSCRNLPENSTRQSTNFGLPTGLLFAGFQFAMNCHAPSFRRDREASPPW